MDIICIYWIWMFVQDQSKGVTITTGEGRSSDKTCSAPPTCHLGIGLGLGLASFAVSCRQLLQSTGSVVKIRLSKRPYGTSSEASFRPLVSGIK
jgi:hypothetical protein